MSRLESFKTGARSSVLAMLMGCSATASNTAGDAAIDAPIMTVDVLDSSTDRANEVQAYDVPNEQRDASPVPDVSVRPELHLLLSGTTILPNTAATAVAYVTHGSGLVTDSNIRLQMEGGDGRLGAGGDGQYTYEQAAEDSVNMDRVCYINNGDSGELYRDRLRPSMTGNGFGAFRIVPASTACPDRFVDTGLRTAKVYPSRSIVTPTAIDLRAIALSEESAVEEHAMVNVHSGSILDLANVQAVLARDVLTFGQDTFMLVMARDEMGHGLGCVATTPESDFYNATSTCREPVANESNGCTADRNGYSISVRDSVTINSSHVARDTRGFLTVSPLTAISVQIYTRGIGAVTDNDDDWSVHSLGAGAFVVPVRAHARVDRGEWQLWFGNHDHSDDHEPILQVDIQER